MNLELSRRDVTIISCTFISFLVFAFLASNLSVGNLVNFQNSILKIMFTETKGMTPVGATAFLFSQFISVFAALIFLVLGLAFLSSYGFFRDNRKIALISCVSVVPILIIFHFSITAIFLSAGIIISNIFIVALSNTYGKELKRWVMFRVGSNSISKALMIINILIAVGVFISVLYGLDYYKNSFKEDLTKTVEEITIASLPSELPESLIKDEVTKKVASIIENMPLIDAYMRWLPLLTALVVWFMLESARMFMPSIGGLFTFVLIRIQKIEKKGKK